MVVGIAEDEVVMIINHTYNERLPLPFTVVACLYVRVRQEHYRFTCASSMK